MPHPWYRCGQRAMETCQRTWDVWFWHRILYAQTVFSTVFTGVLRVNRDAAQKHIYWGHMWPWTSPWRTWFYYTGPVTHIASPSASFRRTLEDKAGRKAARLNGSKTSIPSSQSQSSEMLNDAGCLQRDAGWKWVKEDPMSHLLYWYLRPSIIIIDVMGATEFCRSPFSGNLSKWKSITETLWKVLIPD